MSLLQKSARDSCASSCPVKSALLLNEISSIHPSIPSFMMAYLQISIGQSLMASSYLHHWTVRQEFGTHPQANVYVLLLMVSRVVSWPADFSHATTTCSWYPFMLDTVASIFILVNVGVDQTIQTLKLFHTCTCIFPWLFTDWKPKRSS